MPFVDLLVLIVDGGGSVALVAIAWYVRELKKDFKHAQIVSELKHNNTDGRITRVEQILDDRGK